MNISLCYRSVNPDMEKAAKSLIGFAWSDQVEPCLNAVKEIALKKFPGAEWPQKIEPYWLDAEEFDETEDGQTVYEVRLECEIDLLDEGFCSYTGHRNTFDAYSLWHLDGQNFGEYSEPLANIDRSKWSGLKTLCSETNGYWDEFLDKRVTCLVEFSTIRVVPSYSRPGEPHFYNNQDWL